MYEPTATETICLHDGIENASDCDNAPYWCEECRGWHTPADNIYYCPGCGMHGDHDFTHQNG